LPNNKPISFIDIGASQGHFSESLSKYYQVEKAILIEPIPYQIPVLKAKFKDESIYEILNIAISDKQGTAQFYLSNELDVMSSLLKIKEEFHAPFIMTNPGENVAVATDTLDNLFRLSGLKHVDILKIDVQGAEHLVLQSGVQTLKSTRLVFLEFSYKPLYDGSSTFFDIYKTMNDNNFRMVCTSPACYINDELMQANALFISNAFFPK